MEGKSKIIIRRRSEWINRMRGYKVFINDLPFGVIKNDTTEEYTIESGLQLVHCKVDWCGSQQKELMLKPGEIAYLQVKSNLTYFSYIYILILVGIFGRIGLRASGIIFPSWAVITYAMVAIAGFLYMIYFLTVGRNRYLVVETDQDNVFA